MLVDEILGSDDNSTDSNVAPRIGEWWYTDVWEKYNELAEDIGTPEQWNEIEARAIDRAWNQILTGDACKQMRVLGRDFDVSVGNPHPDGYRSGRAPGKTCKRDHVFTPETTYVRKSKKNGKAYEMRECLICKNERNRNRKKPIAV